TYPVEQFAAATAVAGLDSVSALYDALAAHARVRREVTVSDPRVGADVLVREDGKRFAWLVSQASERVTVKPQLTGAARLCELDGSPAPGSVTLEPFCVGVFLLSE